MRLHQGIFIPLLALCIGMIFQKCTPRESEKKVVTYINSFHRGHPSSDDIMDGILENFPTDSFDIDTYFMDTKRNPSRDHIEKIAAQLFDTIMANDPDILLIAALDTIRVPR